MDYINEIFEKGADDLQKLLGTILCKNYCLKVFSDDKYFPQYVSEPVDYWLNVCDRARTDVEMIEVIFSTRARKRSKENYNGKNGIIVASHVAADSNQK